MKGLVGLEVSLEWVAFSPRFGRLNGPSNVMVSGGWKIAPLDIVASCFSLH